MEAGGEKEHDIFLEVNVGWNDWSGRTKKVIVRDQGSEKLAKTRMQSLGEF